MPVIAAPLQAVAVLGPIFFLFEADLEIDPHLPSQASCLQGSLYTSSHTVRTVILPGYYVSDLPMDEHEERE